jgi:ADP-heptose:LPS heptosyltransferase
VVVLRALGLGDLLTGLPAMRGLRRAMPDVDILLAAPRWLEPVALLSGAVDAVLDTAPLGPVRVARPRLAVNLHGRGPQSTATLRDLQPDALWAFDLPRGPRWEPADGADAACGGREPAEREVARWCRLLAAYGVPADPDDLALARPDRAAGPSAAGRNVTLVHPGGAAPARRWPAERWARVARGLADRGHRVVVTGGAAESALARRVAYGAGLGPAAVLAGATDLLDLCALVAGARLVVAADTGVGHLATAYGTASVLVFGPVPPAVWGPPADRPRHRALWAGRRGDPFAPTPGAGLLAVSSANVLTAVDELVACSHDAGGAG